MKLNGKEIKNPNVEIIVIPRGDGEDIVLTAHAILDRSAFEQLCPEPKAPTVLRKGGERSRNVEDPKYIASMEDYYKKQAAWTILTSLRLGTPELTWDTVDYADPNTWPKYTDELKAAGFTDREIVMVIRGCLAANSLDDAKIEAARERFFRSRLQQVSE